MQLKFMCSIHPVMLIQGKYKYSLMLRNGWTDFFGVKRDDSRTLLNLLLSGTLIN